MVRLGAQAAAPAGVPAGAANGGMRQGGSAPDFQQMLSRMPTVGVADLHKGDAVLVVATEGTAAGATAITLLSGVEPILQAAPTGSQAMVLTPWSLGGAPGGEACSSHVTRQSSTDFPVDSAMEGIK